MRTTQRQHNILLGRWKKVRYHSTMYDSTGSRYSDDFAWFYRFIGIIAYRSLSDAKSKVIKAKILIQLLFLCIQKQNHWLYYNIIQDLFKQWPMSYNCMLLILYKY